MKQVHWPFKGKIAIKEHCSINELTSYLLFDQWRHVGTVPHREELLQASNTDTKHDFDAYKILQSFLKNSLREEQLIEL